MSEDDNVVKRARERCQVGNIDAEYVMLLAREVAQLRKTNSKLQKAMLMLKRDYMTDNDN